MTDVVRQRVKAAWSDAKTLRVIGVDPGFASIGWAVLEQSEGKPIKSRAVGVIETAKGNGKKSVLNGFSAIRASTDDSRRLKEIYRALRDVVTTFGPHVLCVEPYAPHGARAGNAWKTAYAYGLIQALGMQFELLAFEFLPSDLKRAFSLTQGASKTAIGVALCDRVEGLEDQLQAALTRKDQWEHATDAAAHAYLGFATIAELRAATGDL